MTKEVPPRLALEPSGMNYAIILKEGCPVLIESSVGVFLFLITPFVCAFLGALLCQGSWFRIAGAAAGGALRDVLISAAVTNGLITVSNPDYQIAVSFLLAYLTASGAALLATLSPYRGPTLWFMSGLGAGGGQFLLSKLLHRPATLLEGLRLSVLAEGAEKL